MLRGGGEKKKALCFEIVYCPYNESGWEGLHVSKAYSDASTDFEILRATVLSLRTELLGICVQEKGTTKEANWWGSGKGCALRGRLLG